MTIKDFINKYLGVAIDCATKRGLNPAIAFVCISQCALETGWLKSDLMRENNAPFGIKWVDGCGFDYYIAKTREYINGSYVSIDAKFRKYNTIADAFNDYYDFLSCGRYKECLNCTTVKDAITIIKNKGYATDPAYITSVMAVYDTIVHNLRG